VDAQHGSGKIPSCGTGALGDRWSLSSRTGANFSHAAVQVIRDGVAMPVGVPGDEQAHGGDPGEVGEQRHDLPRTAEVPEVPDGHLHEHADELGDGEHDPDPVPMLGVPVAR
jgi:hypothetical protein